MPSEGKIILFKLQWHFWQTVYHIGGMIEILFTHCKDKERLDIKSCLSISPLQ